MPLTVNCPACGQEATVPDAAASRRARCASCRSVYAVGDALAHKERSHAEQNGAFPSSSMSLSEKLSLGLGLGITAVMLLVFAVYWFRIRDTWETDNYSEILARCEAVLQASNATDDKATIETYQELTAFIGDHVIESSFLADRLRSAELAIKPAIERRERARSEREAQELAERKRREALAEAQRRRELAREAAEAASRREKTYKGFSESELQRLYDKLKREGYSSEDAILTVRDMLNYPDTRAVAREWLRNN